MEIVDLEKFYNNETKNFCGTSDGKCIDTNVDIQLHKPDDNFINNAKIINHQAVVSRQTSLDLPEKPTYLYPHSLSVFSRGETDNTTNLNSLKKRRASRLNSNMGNSTKEDEEQDTAGGILARYVERASVPGLAYLYTSRTRLARLAWCAMLLVTLCSLTLHMFYLVDTYLSYQKHSQVSLGFDSLQFPAITFCNVNPARNSRLKLGSEELQSLVQKINPEQLTKQMVG
ncbi:amiloride-sensitive sodium channel subunit beta [Plakobranchus ocellatus]|uniref:Amiloride-sensitive sodium channel subunit beta n=1 Tax=Plakobranchus ocellatus TaxID=259542 RepID=A0AAV3YSV0_9GAST|nr:amiloride-sensitive sodium channel subunit beta [Plakobranchus ocellatus]